MSSPPRDLVPEFWGELAALLPVSPVVLDLGSHHLEEAGVLIPLLGGVPEWHGFEPNRECCEFARRVVLPRFEGTARVVLTEAAVGRVRGSTLFYRSRKTDGGSWTSSSSTRRPKDVLRSFPWMAFDEGVPVQVVTLDDYCAEHRIRRADFIKMDIQGAEVDAVAGGQLIFSCTKYVLTEVVEYEEYEGQLGLRDLMASLPGKWSVVERLKCDALLANDSLQG